MVDTKTVPVACECGAGSHSMTPHNHPDGSRSSSMTCDGCGLWHDCGRVNPIRLDRIFLCGVGR